ncbi:CoA transferase [Microbacterium terregens]|uniref:CoA transferase n=1 Tax=Microbacterium terregens TaxID=69363 RepID=A0ABV5SUZ7_9MICO
MRSLAIDLRHPHGHALFRRLVMASDVVIDNFRSGVLGRLRIDHGALLAMNPHVSSVSITGFGTSGPMQHEPGFDPVLGAMSGMMFAQGGSDDPVMHTVAINDVTAGIMAALGSCLAVYARRTGAAAGQQASTSLAAASAFAQMGELVRYASRPPARVGSADHLGATPLSRSYQASDGWVRIHAEDEAAQTLVRAGVVGSADSAVLGANLETLFAASTCREICEIVREHGIVAVVARSMSEATSDDGALAVDLFHPMSKADGGRMMVPGRLAHFSRTPQTAVLGPPGLGEYSRGVLGGFGVDNAEIDELVRDGVVVEGSPMRIVGMPGYR